MCWTCGCGHLEEDHGDDRNLVTYQLEDAASAAGVDLPQAVGNIVVSLSHFDPNWGKTEKGLIVPAELDYLVTKGREERRYTLGLAYPALKADAHKAADGRRDFIGEDALEDTAWAWLEKYRDVNLFHRDGTSGHFRPTESYIYRGPDWEQTSPVNGRKYLIKAGDWLVGGIWDDFGWAAVKAKLINGWSPEGTARRRVPSSDDLARLRR